MKTVLSILISISLFTPALAQSGFYSYNWNGGRVSTRSFNNSTSSVSSTSISNPILIRSTGITPSPSMSQNSNIVIQRNYSNNVNTFRGF